MGHPRLRRRRQRRARDRTLSRNRCTRAGRIGPGGLALSGSGNPGEVNAPNPRHKGSIDWGHDLEKKPPCGQAHRLTLLARESRLKAR
jgi:hypothetical protein